jgi:hypothetical protein
MLLNDDTLPSRAYGSTATLILLQSLQYLLQSRLVMIQQTPGRYGKSSPNVMSRSKKQLVRSILRSYAPSR